MRASEIISEAKMDPRIRKEMENKGYKLMGKGQDQDVYLDPRNGTILKIFGTDRNSHNSYTKGQQSVIDFANYCQKHPDNPFLPQFSGIERFFYGGEYYLQIRCERLFEFKDAEYIANQLEGIANNIDHGNSQKQVVNRYKANPMPYQGDADDQNKFILYIGGEQELKQLTGAIKDLSNIADRKNYGFDLHSGNFMLGSDGHIVINDPFFTGTWR